MNDDDDDVLPLTIYR